jgi:hypothetical protein
MSQKSSHLLEKHLIIRVLRFDRHTNLRNYFLFCMGQTGTNETYTWNLNK